MRCADWTWGLSWLLFLGVGRTQGQAQTNSSPNRHEFKCGGDVVADSGFVGSEGFPTFYKPDSKCTWHITVPEGHVVVLSFRIFDLEADSLCRYDYLDVFNGHSKLVQKLGRFCGTFRPATLISTTNTMMLEMVSDSATGGRGFLAYFTGGNPNVDGHQFCGGKITKAQGSIKTPNWPEKYYPTSISCSWLITVDPDMVIEVKFDKFNLEPDSYCRFDYAAFFNGGEKDDSRLIGKYCGNDPPPTLVTNGNVLLVQFVSDSSVTSDGFMAMYNSIPRGSKSPTVGDTVMPGADVELVHSHPVQKPISTVRPAPAPTPAPRFEVPLKPEIQEPKEEIIKPVRTPIAKPGQNRTGTLVRRPRPKNPISPNPLCPKVCKRDGTIKKSFCNSEFVITGKVTAVTPTPQGSLQISVSLIKAYKAGRLTITQAGETMSVRLTSLCKTCPLLRRGLNYILMGQVDQDGQATLSPGSFTAVYKPQQQKLLNNLTTQPC